MECYSDFALLKYNGEIDTADEPRHIVGVTVDREADSIIVTYPHVVQQIKLLREAPWTEVRAHWRTELRLSGGVLWCGAGDSGSSGRYVALCGGDTVRAAARVAQLGSADKHTFRMPIFKILIRTDKDPLILFRNGDCSTLRYGLEHCKTFIRRAPIKESSTIVEATSYTRDDTDYVCFLAKDKHNNYSVINYPLKDEVCDYQHMRTAKVSDSRDCKGSEISVKGCCIVAGATENPSVYFTWSDAYIGVYDVVKNCWKLKFYPLAIQSKYESTLVCLKRNLILFSGKYRDIYDDKDNSSYTVTIHKTLPRRWGYGHLRQRPYSRDTRAYDCEDYVVMVEPSRVTVWHITVTDKESFICFRNDSERLFRHLRTEQFLPVFGNPKKYNHRRIF